MVSKWVHLKGLCPSFTFHRRFPVLNYQHSWVKVGLPYSFPREPLRTVCVCNSNTASQPSWRQNNAALQSKPDTYNATECTVQLPMRRALCLLGFPNSNLGLPWMGSILSSRSGYYC